MTLPASLTPPLGYVDRSPFAPDAMSRRPLAVEATGKVDAMARSRGRDFAQHRHAPPPSRSRSDDASAFGDTGAPASANADRAATSPAVEENQALTLRRVLDIRARTETDELVELPVPVTEILLISMNRTPEDPVAGINARSLYAGMQDVFSRDAPPSSRTVPDTMALRAA